MALSLSPTYPDENPAVLTFLVFQRNIFDPKLSNNEASYLAGVLLRKFLQVSLRVTKLLDHPSNETGGCQHQES